LNCVFDKMKNKNTDNIKVSNFKKTKKVALGKGLAALLPDIDPGTGSHLTVHSQTLFIKLVEMIPVCPVRYEVGISD